MIECNQKTIPPLPWHAFIEYSYMLKLVTRKVFQRFLLYLVGFLVFVFVFLMIVAERFVGPLINERLRTLIVQGSEGLYTYKLDGLDASFLGGSVEVENLRIDIDSARYRELLAKEAVPSLTMQLDVGKAHIKGIGVFALLFSKKVLIHEIFTQDANVRLIRHKIKRETQHQSEVPLWKAIRPAIKLVDVDQIKLDGIKLLYKSADTAESMKLQFDTCYAVFNDIRIDSIAAQDESRIGFTKEIDMRFRDLKFRMPDSTYKMKAEAINFSSKNKILELVDFKVQPTLKDKEAFYKAVGVQRSMNVITFERAKLTNFQLGQFVRREIISADSLLIEKPEFYFYTDKTQPPLLESKMGKYPHQQLLNMDAIVQIKGMAVRNANLTYIEKGEKTHEEGKLTLNGIDMSMSNITNDPQLIKRNPRCIAKVYGGILGNSPLNMEFIFYLDSTNGRFDVTGSVRHVDATQLNALAIPLANTRLQSFNMQYLRFQLSGNDNEAWGSVFMRYNNLYVVLQKKDEETGKLSIKKFLTKIVNKYTLKDSNPGPDGRERTAVPVIRARITTQSFFGLIWQTLFTGMQTIMVNSGRIE
ncbi:hypothetical protein SY85_16775 [Flavisolibacter tropicus]|uniref:DUF748 domain-containing protein n=2 Tax=Flavisolibacter tropicus TaxID=1492898 RepID=A0A172TXY6_9BACT|nr:hypothetical protein SY85_16775 [Flavisolibacter tropicus]